jgi:hypothetical protein
MWRLLRRHWLVAPPLVGIATYLLQAAIYSLGSRPDVFDAALDQAVLNFVIAVGVSIYLRVRYRD